MEDTYDVVHCATCGYVSLNLALTYCPGGGEVLGEITLTWDEFMAMQAEWDAALSGDHS